MLNVETFDSLNTLYTRARDLCISSMRKNPRRPFNLAISGGSTPMPLFKLLGAASPMIESEEVNIFWVDERWVPADHPDSNYGTAMKNGLKNLKAEFHPYETDTTPEEACRRYQSLMERLFDKGQKLDLVILGAGSDGHTASVFEPDIDKATGRDKVIITRHPESGQTRLSMSLSLISQAEEIVLLLTGSSKKHILEKLLHNKLPYYPIEYVSAMARSLTLLTDIHE